MKKFKVGITMISKIENYPHEVIITIEESNNNITAMHMGINRLDEKDRDRVVLVGVNLIE